MPMMPGQAADNLIRAESQKLKTHLKKPNPGEGRKILAPKSQNSDKEITKLGPQKAKILDKLWFSVNKAAIEDREHLPDEINLNFAYLLNVDILAVWCYFATMEIPIEQSL
ncbi:hypothetical protein C8F04DRAFT_1241534 [Mycena alexandri]|uniref:Uncharacterized protein n=1 Tax=Mycena alexandri TaxID=1745969 RepID=A0AAD6S687_9AGAR|nr:hypothetical protein C8F04DRAFT_1241534 [Mycena alexandri]